MATHNLKPSYDDFLAAIQLLPQSEKLDTIETLLSIEPKIALKLLETFGDDAIGKSGDDASVIHAYDLDLKEQTQLSGRSGANSVIAGQIASKTAHEVASSPVNDASVIQAYDLDLKEQTQPSEPAVGQAMTRRLSNNTIVLRDKLKYLYVKRAAAQIDIGREYVFDSSPSSAKAHGAYPVEKAALAVSEKPAGRVGETEAVPVPLHDKIPDPDWTPGHKIKFQIFQNTGKHKGKPEWQLKIEHYRNKQVFQSQYPEFYPLKKWIAKRDLDFHFYDLTGVKKDYASWYQELTQQCGPDDLLALMSVRRQATNEPKALWPFQAVRWNRLLNVLILCLGDERITINLTPTRGAKWIGFRNAERKDK